MSIQPRWARAALGSLLALTALGTWGCCSVRCCDQKASVVVVSSADAVTADPVVISKKRHQEILWKLPPDSTIDYIAIDLAGKPAPFESCETAEGVCRIACGHHLCSSGAINPALDPPHAGIYYGYHFHHGETVSSDPGIRIDP
jgi:hypothetical protein